MHTLEPVLNEIPFFQGLKTEHLGLIAGCARNVRFKAGEFAGHAGDPADKFWAVRQGRITLEMFVPGRGALTISTASEGDVAGFSWLVPPHQLRFDVRALDDTRALEFDGRCLRGKFETDPAFGFELLGRFSRLVAQRLEATGLQLVDIYGDHVAEQP